MNGAFYILSFWQVAWVPCVKIPLAILAILLGVKNMAVDRAFIVLFVLASSCFVIGEDELQTLDDSTFERLTQAATGATTGDWLVVL